MSKNEQGATSTKSVSGAWKLDAGGESWTLELPHGKSAHVLCEKGEWGFVVFTFGLPVVKRSASRIDAMLEAEAVR